jgi:hypothetical protein
MTLSGARTTHDTTSACFEDPGPGTKGRVSIYPLSCDNRGVIETDAPVISDNGYNVMGGWRVGQAPEDTTTRSGLLVPVGTKDGNDALALVDVQTGQRFWAVPTGAWRFIWPPTGKPVIAVRESQIIAEEELDHVDEGQYL